MRNRGPRVVCRDVSALLPERPVRCAPPASGAPAKAAAPALGVELPGLPGSTSPLSWSRLTDAEHIALAPFASVWDTFSDERKRKWIKIASRYSKLTPEQQKGLHDRMTEWVRLTPEQRRVARENYQVSKELPREARQKAWKAYQQLPEEQKERLAASERKRRPTVVSAPPSGKTELKDIDRLVNGRERAASGVVATASASRHRRRAAGCAPAIPACRQPCARHAGAGFAARSAVDLQRLLSTARPAHLPMNVPTAPNVPDPLATPQPSAAPRRPHRRYAAGWPRMLYEGVILFGVVFLAGYLFSTLTQQRNGLTHHNLLAAWIGFVVGLYFVWFWTHSGQTLPMKTWRLRVVAADGSPLSTPRAIVRYVLAWLWFLPPLALHPLLGLSRAAHACDCRHLVRAVGRDGPLGRQPAVSA